MILTTRRLQVDVAMAQSMAGCSSEFPFWGLKLVLNSEKNKLGGGFKHFLFSPL